MTEENTQDYENTDDFTSEPVTIDARTLLSLENLVRSFCTTIKLLKLYPINNPIPGQALDKLFAILEDYLAKEGDLKIDVFKDGLSVSSKPIGAGNEMVINFASDLYNRNLSNITFYIGLSRMELANFLTCISRDADVIKSQGGLDTLLWENEISNISVEEIVRKIVDLDTKARADELQTEQLTDISTDAERIDRLLEKASPANKSEWIMLTRMISRPQEISRYFYGLSHPSPTKEVGDGSAEGIDRLDRSLQRLGSIIGQEAPNLQPALYRNLAEAVFSLADEDRLRLLGEKVLPKTLFEQVAINLISQFSPDELATNIAQIVSQDPSQTEMMSDILHRVNLSSQIKNNIYASLSKQLGANSPAWTKLRPVTTETVTSGQLPPAQEEARPKRFDTHVSEMIDELTTFSTEEIEAITHTGLAISEHSAAATTVNTLLDMLAQEERLVQFSHLISLLEDISASLIDHRQFSLTVRVVKALREQLTLKRDYTPKYKERLEKSIIELGSPQNIQKLVYALPGTEKEGEEVKNIHAYLALLDRKVVISSLLEILANEKEMSLRKLVSSIITTMGQYDVSSLGRKVSDPRWYFVRNIVEILGQIGSEEAIPYLDATLRHSDNRIRKETIRSLGLIGGQKSLELLLFSLNDKDTSICQMAAKWIGSTRNPQAIVPLAQIVRKRDPLNRNHVLKKYAIESLGLIGSNEVLPVLEKVISKKALLNKGQQQEIRESAIEALRQVGTAEAKEILEKVALQTG